MTHDTASGLAASLAAAALLSEQDARRYLALARAQHQPLVSFLVDNRILDSQALASFCAREYGLPVQDLAGWDLAGIPHHYLDQKLIEQHHVLPLYHQDHTLYIAMSDPTNITALEDFGFSFGLATEALLVEERPLTAAIGKLLTPGRQAIDESEIAGLALADTPPRLDEPGDGDDDAPMVKYINQIMMDAIRRRASDLHFEPYETRYRIRFRIDGILHEIASPPVTLANRFSARLKVMARLNIAERRLPQDGRIKLTLPHHPAMDLRVSTLPTLWGEKIVIRLLDGSATGLDMGVLGLDDEQKASYLAALARPQGMILVTGPTGSGKTVSLYTGLTVLNTTAVNIATAEDPVEINLPGVNQVEINPKAGLTFASALRAFLRQDPDVVMVGEIRDLETAEVAIKAAQTGHLVLSTLHTNSAAETLTRLINMGVPAFNIASAVTLIMAQRLARKLCIHCKKALGVPKTELLAQGFSQQQLAAGMDLYKPVGCSACSGGYMGRLGIYELMPMSDTIANAMMAGSNALTIAAIARQEGMRTLRSAGLETVRQGITSLAEINRVTTH